MGTGPRIVVFVVVLVGGFVYASRLVTDLRGTRTGATAGLTVDFGEEIFWGKGTCATCHKVGDRGSNKRCPDQADVAVRAVQRAAERTASTGRPYSASDYLVESVATPSAYVVEGFPDGLMPLVYAPPVDLSVNEVLAVLLYLQSLGGTADLEALQQSMRRFGEPIRNRSMLVNVAQQQIRLLDPAWEVLTAQEMATFVDLDDEGRAKFLEEKLDEDRREELEDSREDWLEEGRDVFAAMKCWQCHTIAGEDFGPIDQGNVGPDLSSIGSIQKAPYLLESLLNPNAVIVAPQDVHTGEDGKSKMPDFSESITARQLLQLVYYLGSLRAAPSDAVTLAAGPPVPAGVGRDTGSPAPPEAAAHAGSPEPAGAAVPKRGGGP